MHILKKFKNYFNNHFLALMLFGLNSISAVGVLPVDEEFMVGFIILVIFLILTLYFKEQLLKYTNLNCFSIWEFMNYELKLILGSYQKIKTYILNYIIFKYKYKFWFLWSLFLLQIIYIKGFVLTPLSYKIYLDLFCSNLLYKFAYLEIAVAVRTLESIHLRTILYVKNKRKNIKVPQYSF